MNRKQIIGGFAATAAFLSGLVYFLFYTATGLTWYINYVISPLPGKVEFKNVLHTLKGNCEISGFLYRSESIVLKLERVRLKWNPFALLHDELAIQRIAATDVELTVIDSNDMSLPVSIRQTAFPLVMNIEHGSLENLVLHSRDDSNYRIRSINFNQLYFDQTVFVDKLIAQDGTGNSLEVSGEAGLRSSDIINLTTQSSMQIPGANIYVRSHGTLVGSITQLRFLQRFTAPLNIKVEGRVRSLLSDPYWYFKASVNNALGMTLPDSWHIQSIQGTLTGEGSPAQLEIGGDLEITDAANSLWKTTISSQWNTPGAKFKIAAKQPSSPDAGLTIDGEWTYRDDTAFFRTLLVKGHWQNFQWSNSEASIITSRKGHVDFDGSLLRTKINANNVAIEPTGTQIDTLSIAADPDKQQNIALKGDARTSSGKLVFSGHLEKTSRGYQLKTLSLTGRHFDLVSKPNAHIIVSPDITLTSKNNSLHSTGNIQIPKANIRLQKLHATYQQIATLLSGNTNVANHAPQHVIDKVNIMLGDGVWMQGFGLNAQVTGELALVDLFNNAMLANGELNVLHGNYKRDNRHYSVTGGKITFHQQSLDNPEVAIKIAGGNLPNNNTDTVKGLLQNLYKKENAGKLALNP
ncbi:MAG: translocation/assembly module TamB domain-containing protein [Gammaproteobacteria bacterium]|jgi:hypothetical protein